MCGGLMKLERVKACKWWKNHESGEDGGFL